MTTSNQPGGPGGRGRPSRPGRQLGHGPPWRAWFARDASGDRALRGSDTVVSLRIRNRESLTDDGQQLQVALDDDKLVVQFLHLLIGIAQSVPGALRI